jgi:hypothetical protein
MIFGFSSSTAFSPGFQLSDTAFITTPFSPPIDLLIFSLHAIIFADMMIDLAGCHFAAAAEPPLPPRQRRHFLILIFDAAIIFARFFIRFFDTPAVAASAAAPVLTPPPPSFIWRFSFYASATPFFRCHYLPRHFLRRFFTLRLIALRGCFSLFFSRLPFQHFRRFHCRHDISPRLLIRRFIRCRY